MKRAVAVKALFFMLVFTMLLKYAMRQQRQYKNVSGDEQVLCSSVSDCGVDFSDAFIADTKSSDIKQ